MKIPLRHSLILSLTVLANTHFVAAQQMKSDSPSLWRGYPRQMPLPDNVVSPGYGSLRKNGFLQSWSPDWKYYSNTNDIFYPALSLEDDSTLWVGTLGGVIRWDLRSNASTFYDRSVGLAENAVICVAIDSQHVKWFGTGGCGVSRFDGTTWTTYNYANTSGGLAGDYVLSLTVDPQGNKWIGTIGGASEFDGTSWKRYNYSNGLGGNSVFAITIDSLGNKWFATDVGISKFDGSVWTRYDTATTHHGLADDYVYTITIDKHGVLWFGTLSGVSRFDGTTWTSYNWQTGLPDNVVLSAGVDRENNKWFGTTAGVAKFDDSTWTIYTSTNSGLANNTIYGGIIADASGNVYIGTYGGGVSVFSGSAWTTYATPTTLVDGFVNAIAIDKAGSMWFGTNGGVSKFDGVTWTNYDTATTSGGLANNVVYAIAFDTHGVQWFGTKYGVSRFDGTTWTMHSVSPGRLPNQVFAIAVDPQGTAWFATWSGVWKFDGTNWTTYDTLSTSHGLPSNIVNAVAIDAQGNKWFGTNGGAAKFDGSVWTKYTTDQGLASNYVNAVAVDQQGNKWFGVLGGLSKFDGTTFTKYTSSQVAGAGSVDAITVDSRGILWFGTVGGVLEFDGSTWKSFTNMDGLGDNHVAAIAIDGDGNKWFGTDGGASEFNEAGITAAALPLSPTALSPALLTGVARRTLFKWSSVLHAYSYHLQVAATSFQTAATVVDTIVQDTAVRTADTLDANTTYYWRVSGMNSLGEGAPSAIAYFVTGTAITVSAIPGLLLPLPNALNQPARVTLVCRKSPDAEQYQWEVSTDRTFLPSRSDWVSADTTTTIGPLAAGTQYYWRVRGVNSEATGDFSLPDSFTVMAAPNVPERAPFPIDGPPFTDSVKMRWYSVPLASGYECQISTSPLFSSLVVTQDSTSDTTFTVRSLQRLTKYFWRVRAYDIGGASGFSTPDSLTTVIEVPGRPSPLSPPENATGVARRTVFTWGTVPNADSYHLQVLSATSPSFIFVVDTVVADTAIKISDTLDANTTYSWRVSGINLGGEGAFSTITQFTTGSVTSTEASRIEIPKSYALMQNYPNPFNPSTTVCYGLPARSRVHLVIYSILGQVVVELLNSEQPAGWNQIVWNANVASGLYFYRLEAVSVTDGKRFVDVKKMILLK